MKASNPMPAASVRRQGGDSQSKASLKASASHMLGRGLGPVFVFPSYSLRILMVFSSYSPLVLRWCLPPRHGVFTEPTVGFHRAGLSGTHIKLHYSASALFKHLAIPAGSARSRLTTSILLLRWTPRPILSPSEINPGDVLCSMRLEAVANNAAFGLMGAGTLNWVHATPC